MERFSAISESLKVFAVEPTIVAFCVGENKTPAACVHLVEQQETGNSNEHFSRVAVLTTETVGPYRQSF